MSKIRYAVASVIGVVLMGACGGADGTTIVAPPVVQAGTAVLAVDAAPTGLAAIRLRVSGPGISGPTVRGSARILLQQTVADTTTFLLAVTSNAGGFLEVRLANRALPPTVSVQEATAGRADGYRALTSASVIVKATVQ